MAHGKGFLLDDAGTNQATGSPMMTISTRLTTGQSSLTTVSSSTSNGSSTEAEVCEDKIDTCSQHGHSPCTNKTYEAWSRHNCPVYCGFCAPQVPLSSYCKDKLGNCNEYDSGDLCTNSKYHTWAYENCRGYCKLAHCNNSICEDSPNVNCTQLDVNIDVCSDMTQARTICRNYCGLCNVTDGKWCSWSSWTSCDVTCGNGTRLRTRQCACPTAENGGAKCPGDDRISQSCSNSCPADGVWSTWQEWSGCSVTCDIGFQRRERYCTNPAPDQGGFSCVGESHDDKICIARACADGNWSDWSGWSNCSKICGGGIRSKSRTCTNPRPSLTGRYCDGNPMIVGTCNTQPCSDHKVAFLAFGCQKGFPANVINFPTATINYHNDYNTVTGKFVCNTPGLYHFAVTLTKVRRFIDLLNAHIVLSGGNVFELHADPAEHGDADYSSYSLSGAITLHLKQGDEVYVTGAWNYYYNDISSSFTGFLILADD